MSVHANMAFSTYDQDHDAVGINCAVQWNGAWWYSNCAQNNLNGLFKGSPVNDWTGMTWYFWKDKWEVLKKSEMKMRRIW